MQETPAAASASGTFPAPRGPAQSPANRSSRSSGNAHKRHAGPQRAKHRTAYHRRGTSKGAAPKPSGANQADPSCANGSTCRSGNEGRSKASPAGSGRRRILQASETVQTCFDCLFRSVNVVENIGGGLMAITLRLTLAPGIDARLPGRVRVKCRARSQSCSRFPQSVACLPFNFQLSTLNCFSASSASLRWPFDFAGCS